MSWLSAWLFYVRQGEQNKLYIASGLLALLLTISLPWMYRRYQSSFVASLLSDDGLRGLVGPIELTVDDQSIRESGMILSVYATWTDVSDIDEHVGYVVIRIAPLVAILIPRRAFISDEARQEFLARIRARLTAHRS